MLESTPADDRRAILRAIDQLQPGGSTNLEAGLRLGYEQARRSLTENGIDRVVVASDGVANVGLTDADGILRGIRDDAANGIELVSVGVGMGNYNDVLLEQLADQGDGFYAYVNGIDDAKTLFRERLTSTLQTVALDAKAQVEFDPRAVEAYRLVGYEDRDIPDGSFTDPRVDAGAIGAGHAVTALYAVRLAEDGPGRDPFATIQLRWTDPDSGAIQRLSREIRASDLAGSFDRTDPHFRLDALVAASAEVMRDSPYADRLRIADIQHVADRVGGPAAVRPGRRVPPPPRRDAPHRRLSHRRRCRPGRGSSAAGPAFRSGRFAVPWLVAGRVGMDRDGDAGVRRVRPAGRRRSRRGPCRRGARAPPASSGPANSTTIARISECSVQAACRTSAGQRTASPAATRVRSSGHGDPAAALDDDHPRGVRAGVRLDARVAGERDLADGARGRPSG